MALPVKQEFIDKIPVKKADVKLTLNNRKNVFIEIKRWLEFNSFGAAFFEAFISEPITLFIFSQGIKESPKQGKMKVSKLIELEQIKPYVAGVVVITPENESLALVQLEKFFKKIEELNQN